MEEKVPKIVGKLLLTCWDDDVIEVSYGGNIDLNTRILALKTALDQELELRDLLLQHDSNGYYVS